MGRDPTTVEEHSQSVSPCIIMQWPDNITFEAVHAVTRASVTDRGFLTPRHPRERVPWLPPQAVIICTDASDTGGGALSDQPSWQFAFGFTEFERPMSAPVREMIAVLRAFDAFATTHAETVRTARVIVFVSDCQPVAYALNKGYSPSAEMQRPPHSD